ncbi:MAG: hypothetical protein ABFD07_16505 [Methanobacterium sp.]
MIKAPTDEDIETIITEMDEEIDYLSIPGIMDIVKEHLKEKILEKWKEKNRVSLCYCEDCEVIQFIKIELEDVSCKHCGSKNTDFVSCLIEEESIPDDFEEPFDLKQWYKGHEELMKKYELRLFWKDK